MDAITTYLDMGTYSEWDEEKKLEFLTRELKGKRPLVPPNIEVSEHSPWVSFYVNNLNVYAFTSSKPSMMQK